MAQNFNFDKSPKRVVAKPIAKRRKQTNLWPIVAVLLVVGFAAGGGGLWYVLRKSLVLEPLAARDVTEMTTLDVTVKPKVKGISADKLRYSLEGAPTGATIDARSGRIRWQPTEEQGGKTYQLKVCVAVEGDAGLKSQQPLAITVKEVNQLPTIAAIDDAAVKGSGDVTIHATASDADVPKQTITFALLKGAPAGSKIDPKTGEFTWSSKAAVVGTDYPVTIVATDSEGGQSKRTFNVRLDPKPGPADEFVTWLKSQDATATDAGRDRPALFPGIIGRTVKLGDQNVRVYEFETADAAETAMRSVHDKQPKKLADIKLFRDDRLVVACNEQYAETLSRLAMRFGEPTVLATASTPEPMPEPLSAEVPQSQETDETVAALCELYEKRRLMLPKEYPALRKIFARAFEKEHESEIRRAYGADYDDMTAWLDAHVEAKEEFYNAIDPRHDKVVKALSLFNALRKEFPKQLAAYSNLAIATAVTWDDKRGAYDYAGHQRRTHSKLPDTLVGPIENFRYFVEAEKVMEGRILYLPWEFLTHIINDKTPLAEREWSMQNYATRRPMFGACYSQVPYDDEMLRTGSKKCKLDGFDYTLPNILKRGGVCAMQADYAARVGKSIGIPSEYVGGESNSGDRHAWVMWVELKQVTPTSIVFSLESHGRYRIDSYYVGELKDAQTGKRITDRELEMTLQSVGASPIARRHALLVMRAYPQVRDQLKLDVRAQIALLNDVIHLSPGHDGAWRGLAALSKGGEIEKPQHKQMTLALDQLFRTFAKFPDFTWQVFDDLIAFQPSAKQRIALYEQLLNLYVQAKRPDLACEARLKLSDYLVAEKRQLDAAEGLGATIMKFPDEGRYVPKMLDKLETICDSLDKADEHLVRFYETFLPMVPKTRAGDPSKYCMEMLARGAEKFREHDQLQLAQACEAELAKLKKKAH